MSDGEIVQMYPTLRPIDVRAAWAYVGQHREEIERDISDNDGDEGDHPRPC